MATYVNESGRFIRASVSDIEGRFDVFISHISEHEQWARRVASIIHRCGLRPWLDVIDMADQPDSPQTADRIEAAISRSYSLITVMTNDTRISWWVPFEIGLAYNMKKPLASYCRDVGIVTLPSFLKRWPRIRDDGDLEAWCREIRMSKARYVVEASSRGKSTYRRDLQATRRMLNDRHI